MPAKEHVSCGVSHHHVNDIYNVLETSTQSGFNFILAPIAHPRFRREFIQGKACHRSGAFTRADLTLTTQDWSTFVVGKVSPWINLDSAVDHVRRNSEKAFEQEMNYASHLSLPAVCIPLQSRDCVNLARFVHSRMMGFSGVQPHYNVWIRVPMKSHADESKIFINAQQPGEECGKGDDFGTAETPSDDTWEWWNTFRTICGTDKKIGVALEMSADLPRYCEIQRWLGEPIKCIMISTSLFTTNKKGFPVLPRPHQNLLMKFFKMIDIQVVIFGNNRHHHMKNYHQYMEHLWTSQEPDDTLATYARGFEDHLQIPLQPLMDNLESQTYEVFEKDPTKYTEYQTAIQRALVDRVSEEEKDTKTTIIMVVGAGRGPLVEASLNAARHAHRLVKVYAIEKNPNAVVTLFSQQYEMWGDAVTVVPCDMRDFNPPERADILVSELLGSFGDNELSPECLDGAQKLLKDDGISIPSSYTSYITPVSTPKLHSEIGLMVEKGKPTSTFFEMPFVVHLHNHTQLAPPQALFTFHHPNHGNQDNSRYGKRTFHTPINTTIHGIAGYFDTVLYKDVKLSIHPATYSPGLFSWFPIFFPLKEPMYVSSKDPIDVHFWRCSSPNNVWYEWLVTSPTVTTVHNPNGRSYTIGL